MEDRRRSLPWVVPGLWWLESCAALRSRTLSPAIRTRTRCCALDDPRALGSFPVAVLATVAYVADGRTSVVRVVVGCAFGSSLVSQLWYSSPIVGRRRRSSVGPSAIPAGKSAARSRSCQVWSLQSNRLCRDFPRLPWW